MRRTIIMWAVALFAAGATALTQSVPRTGFAGPARAAVTCRRAPVPDMEDAKACAMIELSTDDPIRLVSVLKKAWMEGGVKRGLVGTVVTGSESVQILAQGLPNRLDAFAEWLETSSQLVSKVETVDLDACVLSDYDLTDKFKFAEMGDDDEARAQWRELLDQAVLDVNSAAGKTHSSDEGLA